MLFDVKWIFKKTPREYKNYRQIKIHPRQLLLTEEKQIDASLKFR